MTKLDGRQQHNNQPTNGGTAAAAAVEVVAVQQRDVGSSLAAAWRRRQHQWWWRQRNSATEVEIMFPAGVQAKPEGKLQGTGKYGGQQGGHLRYGDNLSPCLKWRSQFGTGVL